MTEPSSGAPDADEEAIARIRDAPGTTLFVEAGAGTGKTWALVQRVVSLVLGGTAIERIAAITFTEKAAAELKDRVREGLETALREHAKQAGLVQPALESLDRAQISTIHSFCQDLLRLFAAEAGVDPSFEVRDEIMAKRRFQERWRGYIEGLSGDVNAAGVIDRALGLGMTTRDIEALAEGLTSRAELVSVLAQSLPEADAPDWNVLLRFNAKLAGLVPPSVPEADELRMRVEAMSSVIDEMLRNPAEREVVLASATGVLGWTFGRCGNAATWGGSLAATRTACAEVSEGLKQLLSRCRSEAIRDLVPLVVRFVEGDARARGRDGLMTFDDLILRVRDLLKEDAQAVRALRERFEALLIDEFQDTDPLQVDIALAFATDPETGEIDSGRLFLVGDPKQSIYRFRRADMAVYSRTREAIKEGGGEFPLLQRNRRSRPVIIDWVNGVFERMMGAGGQPSLQPAYREISHYREEIAVAGPGVARFGGEIVEGNAREVRAKESEAVAWQCRGAVEQKWQVVDKSTKEVRGASYRDIAILLPARTGLAALERSLAEAGVPFRVEGGSLIYRTQEVRDLINCLTAIDDPADEVAIVGALRSPAFACSDVDLGRFVADGGRFNYHRPDLASRVGPVAHGLQALLRYHQGRHERSLAALVDEFVTESGLVETGILHQGDRNSFRRMRYVVEQARAFEANGPESLRALVQWLEGCSQRAMLDHEGAGLDDDEDAVRVLTIHGAKGLEFPIVILAGMGSAPYSRPGAYLVDRTDETIAIQVGTKGNNRRFTLGDVEHLEQVEKEHVEAEFVRMLYVGATRARDHLVLSLFRTQRARKSAAAQLEEAGAADGVAALGPPAVIASEHKRPFEGVAVDAPTASSPDGLVALRRELVERSRTQRYTSATRLGRSGEAKEAGEDDTEPWSRGRAGTRLGRAVHAAVQSLPLEADEVMIGAFARAQAVAEAIPERVDEVARLVRAALTSAGAERARSARRALREVPFAVPLDGVIVEGFVDMLIDTPEGLEIVDWKTDRLPDEEVTARLVDYSLQAGLYVLGIQAATGREVSRVTYVFVSAGREESPGDPALLAEAAMTRIQAGSADAAG